MSLRDAIRRELLALAYGPSTQTGAGAFPRPRQAVPAPVDQPPAQIPTGPPQVAAAATPGDSSAGYIPEAAGMRRGAQGLHIVTAVTRRPDPWGASRYVPKSGPAAP